MGYKEYQPSLGPPWLQRALGSAWNAALGAVKDSLVDRLKQSVKARFPLLAPPDALAALGIERGIDRAPNESDATFASRVQGAWNTWPWAGTAYGLLRALYDGALNGGGDLLEIVNGRESQLAANQALVSTTVPGWVFAFPNTFWSKFLLLISHPYPAVWVASGINSAAFTGGNAGSGTATLSGVENADYFVVVKIIGSGGLNVASFQYSTDGGATYSGGITVVAGPLALGSTGLSIAFSGTFTSGDRYQFSTKVPGSNDDTIARMRRIITAWKPAHSTCAGITVYRTGELWGWPRGTWGDSAEPNGGVWRGGTKDDFTYP